jgi:sporulation integral membrane protein YtvI
MNREAVHRWLLLAGSFLGIWLFLKYLFPIFLPFFLGFLLALAAEPAVRFATRLKLPRWAATGVGVSLTLVLLTGLVGLLGATAVKELGVLAGRLPDLQDTATQTADKLRIFLENAADKAPDGVRPLVDRSVDRLMDSGSALMEQATVRLPGAISGFLSRVPDGALGLGTGILSGFMLSARLPKLKMQVRDRLPETWKTKLFPALKRSKNALLGWLKAQAKLAAVTFCIITAGLLLLRIPLAPLWAAGIALVDAVPLLGTGTVMVPWAVISLIQGRQLRAIGLLCIFGAALLTRTTLEPRLVGRHLGLDPLVTLVFLYLGYRFWGILGMLLAPMLVAAITAAADKTA